ncbi:nucleotide exchange factor GrpE [Ruminiclostridium cellulolyticum]|uniref:Protein GrpE n=1 Tax=Ruminiclostridium cellulolyticum (strain ATCC 35319 / DSM 5812 / JCM 6584 / H10) TaxID=394503 RepID=B8I306_RUMCH|nr:nucleotide exchange factor GrpE [Ruminiclostridium cellulolyticum]ACL76149.1 GrpE protein [Ruminiclostridium cellulolyticum H10]
MKKEKFPNEENKKTNEMNFEENNKEMESDTPEIVDSQGDETVNTEIEELKAKLEEKTKQCEDFKNMVQRTAAEFDNYKKRTVKEKEALSLDAAIDTVNTLLPVVDNLERAVKAAEGMEDNPLKEGVEMVMRQLKDCLGQLGVEAIEAVNNPFDPELHNAVMHVTDDEIGENIVVEEFQKGYTMKGKVIRYSMVKVVN